MAGVSSAILNGFVTFARPLRYSPVGEPFTWVCYSDGGRVYLPPSVMMDLESFKSVFIALVIGGALIVGAFFIQAQRPTLETQQASPDLVQATGTCASCHRRETPAIVAEYERSAHVKQGTNCLDCHQP